MMRVSPAAVARVISHPFYFAAPAAFAFGAVADQMQAVAAEGCIVRLESDRSYRVVVSHKRKDDRA